MRYTTRLKQHSNRLIAVDQDPCKEWLITFNPDDNRFYVHAPTEEGRQGGDVQKTFGTITDNYHGALNNARCWCVKHRYEAQPA